MSKITGILSTFFTILLFSFSAYTQSEFLEIANKLDYNYFYKHVKYFAGDELEGRDVGSEGYNKAAEYTAKEFKASGLEPFGDNNSYFQKIPFAKATIDESTIEFKVKGSEGIAEGVYGNNVSIFLNTLNKSFKDEQELVFVGYGNIIPELKIDDFKGIDVKGKTVIVAFGGPKDLKHESLDNPLTKIQNAVSKGASGILIFFPDKNMLQGIIFKKFHGFVSNFGFFINDPKKNKPFIDLNLVTFAKKNFIKEIFNNNNLSLSKEIKTMRFGGFVSKKINSKIHCSYTMNFKNTECKNIVGILEGSDPVLKNEFVVIGAHLDHLGIGKPVKGDSIYNGMWDNATGSAATISIASTFHKNNIKPKRSIIFINYTAEEKGLYGSDYFANSDLVQGKEIVANINIDMLGGLYETSDFTPEGYSHSNLSEATDFAAKILDLSQTDASPYEKMFVERSDQISFIKIGVPFINIGPGLKALDPNIDAEKNMWAWMDKIYHTPADDLDQTFSNEAFHNALKITFLTAYYIADKMENIKWNQDSWIYKKYVLKKEDENEK